MVVSSPPAETAGERREPTTTLSGWRHFVDAASAMFDLLGEGAWAALAPGDKEAYDDTRVSYHSELVVVGASTLREVTRQAPLLPLLHGRAISARPGVIESWAA